MRSHLDTLYRALGFAVPVRKLGKYKRELRVKLRFVQVFCLGGASEPCRTLSEKSLAGRNPKEICL